MGLKKYIFYLLLLVFLSSNVFAGEVIKDYTENNDIEWDWEVWKTTDPNKLILDSTLDAPIDQGSSEPYGIGSVIIPEASGETARLFRFPKYTEDYVLKNVGIDLGDTLDSAPLSFYFAPYNNTLQNQEIAKNQPCRAKTLHFDKNTQILRVSSNLKPLQTSSRALIQNTEIIEDLMNKYYYMKTSVTAELMRKDGVQTNFIVYPDTVISGDVGEVSSYQNYVLLKPDVNEFSFVLPTDNDIFDMFGDGKYYWIFTAKPIDMKCNFDVFENLPSSTSLDPDESEIKEYQTPVFKVGKPLLDIDEIHIRTKKLIKKQDIITYTDNPYYSSYYTLNDTYTARKIIYNNETNDIKYINKDNIEQNIIIPETKDKEILVYKNGINIRNDTILPQEIALKHHQIRKLDNASIAQKFINDSYNVMLKTNITIRIDNETVIGKTNIKIQLEIPQEIKENITLYQIIPKDIAESIDDIKFINNGTAKLLILDKDPVIGWYFNESGGTEEIEYQINGSNETGTIIITQEPILFNEGDLIINYRETNCNVDEAQLFEIDDLIESKIYNSGSNMTYKVCVGHTSETLDATINPLTYHLFNYTNSSNLSLTNTLLSSVDISVLNTTPIFWDLKIQETNPSGDYSCLGSIDNEDSSLFGDCAYTTKRLWIHLGEDLTGPTTTLFHPNIAHTLMVTLSAEDVVGGSGVDKTYYCIKNDTEDCSNTMTFIEYISPFHITCNTTWGCYKEVFYYSTDLIGNQEIVKSQVLKLIDKGSACQADCTAQPFPDRYLKECISLNGCEYYDYNKLGIFDGGSYVAKQCDHLIKDSWAIFNDTHEIKCPVGPFREKIFSIEKLFYKSNDCDNLQIIKNLIYVNGESVTMNIVYCADN